MEKDSISGVTDYVNLSTSGCLVVLHTSFSQHISAVEFIPALVPVMSE